MPRQLSVSLIVLVMTASVGWAQTAPSRSQESITQLNLLIEPQLVRFTTPGEALDWRLEIVDQQGQPVFDSAFVSGRALDWPLVNGQGQAIESGLYAYTVTIRGGNPQAVRIHRGQLTIERASTIYRISATGDETSGDTALTVVASAEPEPATGEQRQAPAAEAPSHGGSFRQPLAGQTFAPQPYISGSGTTLAMTRWVDGPGGVVGDTQVTEVNGSVVVGNSSFKGNLQIYGNATSDVFAGMGPDLISGPGFNFGYAGASFGRSAGFFNVRPDASAVAPNPSLRFMTANVQRMIITNTGKVGIGTLAPNHQVRIVGGPLWTSSAWQGALELDNAAAIAWRPLAGTGGKSVGIGLNNGGLYFFRTLSEPADTTNPPDYQMFISDQGSVGIGTITPSSKLHVVGTGTGVLGESSTNAGVVGSSGSNYGVIGTANNGHGVRGASNSGFGVYAESSSGYGVFALSSSNYAGFFQGNVHATGTITQNSDVRLKHNVANLDYGLREVLRLRPVTWSWTDRPDRGRQLGLIAQEIEPVIPELVARGKDEAQTLGLNYIGLVPVVIKAIQEQQATIQDQQATIGRLTEENVALKARLVAIEQALAAMGGPRKE
jgi:hypothetical protein